MTPPDTRTNATVLSGISALQEYHNSWSYSILITAPRSGAEAGDGRSHKAGSLTSRVVSVMHNRTITHEYPYDISQFLLGAIDKR